MGLLDTLANIGQQTMSSAWGEAQNPIPSFIGVGNALNNLSQGLNNAALQGHQDLGTGLALADSYLIPQNMPGSDFLGRGWASQELQQHPPGPGYDSILGLMAQLGVAPAQTWAAVGGGTAAPAGALPGGGDHPPAGAPAPMAPHEVAANLALNTNVPPASPPQPQVSAPGQPDPTTSNSNLDPETQALLALLAQDVAQGTASVRLGQSQVSPEQVTQYLTSGRAMANGIGNPAQTRAQLRQELEAQAQAPHRAPDLSAPAGASGNGVSTGSAGAGNYSPEQVRSGVQRYSQALSTGEADQVWNQLKQSYSAKGQILSDSQKDNMLLGYFTEAAKQGK